MNKADLWSAFLLPWMACMPAMQEQLRAIAMDGMYARNAGAIAGDCPAVG